MKKLLILLISLGITAGVSAQRGFYKGGGSHYSRPHVAIALGTYIPLNPYPYYGFSPFYPYAPRYGYGSNYNRPTHLDLAIEDIRNDYKERIWSARHDQNLSRKERRQKVHELKHEKEQAIIDAKRNYYKS